MFFNWLFSDFLFFTVTIGYNITFLYQNLIYVVLGKAIINNCIVNQPYYVSYRNK